MRNKEESNFQKACYSWFCLQYPKLYYCLFSVPNGGSRNAIEAIHLKREGVTSGVSDFIFCYRGICTFIELKTKSGIQSDNQKKFENKMREEGFDYHIVRDIDSFMELINDIIMLCTD